MVQLEVEFGHSSSKMGLFEKHLLISKKPYMNIEHDLIIVAVNQSLKTISFDNPSAYSRRLKLHNRILESLPTS